MDRSGHVLVMWWALFVIVQCVLVVLCGLGSSTSSAMPMTTSALLYVPWCTLWASLLALAARVSCGAPLSTPSQSREGQSVAMALCGWLPWRCLHGARQATTTSSRHVDATPLHVAPVPVRTAHDAPLSAPPRHHADESVAEALSGWRLWRCFRGARQATTVPARFVDTLQLSSSPLGPLPAT